MQDGEGEDGKLAIKVTSKYFMQVASSDCNRTDTRVVDGPLAGTHP